MRASLFLVFMLLLTAGFYFLSCGKQDNAAAAENAKTDSTSTNDTTASKNKEASVSVPVEISQVHRGDVYDFILQNATMDTEKGVEVYSRLTGVVVRLQVEEGSRVTQDQVLCQLEDDDYRLARDKAGITYEKQKADFQRYQGMFEKQLISAEQYEQAKFNLEQARIDLETAELNLKRTRITAPIGGVVTTRHVRLGERVTTAAPLFRIVNMDEKIAVIHIPERETDRVRAGQRAYLTTENLPEMRFQAEVKRISPAVDATSGTFKVTVGVNDPENALRPGMFVAVHVVTATHSNALLIPKASVVYENGLPYAFFVNEDTLARRVRLEKGFSDEQFVEVLSSVSDIDRVIVVGQNSLKDGARIKVVAGFLEQSPPDSNLSSAEKDSLLPAL